MAHLTSAPDGTQLDIILDRWIRFLERAARGEFILKADLKPGDFSPVPPIPSIELQELKKAG